MWYGLEAGRAGMQSPGTATLGAATFSWETNLEVTSKDWTVCPHLPPTYGRAPHRPTGAGEQGCRVSTELSSCGRQAERRRAGAGARTLAANPRDPGRGFLHKESRWTWAGASFIKYSLPRRIRVPAIREALGIRRWGTGGGGGAPAGLAGPRQGPVKGAAF